MQIYVFPKYIVVADFDGDKYVTKVFYRGEDDLSPPCVFTYHAVRAAGAWLPSSESEIDEARSAGSMTEAREIIRRYQESNQ
jgi:hypothetical protein